MSTVVCKFGGSSVKDAEAIRQVLSIIEKEWDRRYIVLSAPGKRFPSDEKVTDLLLGAYQAAKREDKKSFSFLFEKIRERFDCFSSPLSDSLWDEAERQIRNGASEGFALSRGEYITAKLFSERTGYPVLQPENCLYLRNGVLLKKSYAALKKCLPNDRAIIPGFYGMGEKGIETFPRGGGDITASVVANAASAELCENWTDVNGVRFCDPNILSNARGIKKLSYFEMRLLAGAGARVLHSDAVLPLQRKRIPLLILNTFFQENGETLVCSSAKGREGMAGFALLKSGEICRLTAADERMQGKRIEKALIESLRLLPIQKSGRGKGYAYVEFPISFKKLAARKAYEHLSDEIE